MELSGNRPPAVTPEDIESKTGFELVGTFPLDTYADETRRQDLLKEVTKQKTIDKTATVITSFFLATDRQLRLGVFRLSDSPLSDFARHPPSSVAKAVRKGGGTTGPTRPPDLSEAA